MHPHQEHEERWGGAGILVLVGVLVGHQELNGFLERKMVFKRQLNTGDGSSLKLEGYPKGFVHFKCIEYGFGRFGRFMEE